MDNPLSIVPEADSLAKTEPGRSQAGLLASGSTFRCAFPSPPHTSTVAFAAVVAGYSGASAADFHGLPYSARRQASNL